MIDKQNYWGAIEFYYKTPVIQIEFDNSKNQFKVVFADYRMALLDKQTIDTILYIYNQNTLLLVYNQSYTNPYCVPEEPKCLSCGKNHQRHVDRLGRCENTLKKFWNKVRSLYWYRYSKNYEENKSKITA